MGEQSNTPPSETSVLKAMELAWKDHHHARDQTWKAVQIVFGLGAGLFTVDFSYKDIFATSCAGLLVIVAAWFGASITWNHRILERRKFIHLMNCEEWLGLHKDNLIPLQTEGSTSDDAVVRDAVVQVPKKFRLHDIFNPVQHNTALFILRMHIAIMLFAVLVVIFRYMHK